jgi:hypothetical protein
VGDLIRVGRGRIAIPRETYLRYLDGVPSVAVVEIDGAVHIVPLRGPVAGGRLLKQRNRDGDRVVEAADFLAVYGVGPLDPDRELPVRWNAAAAALRIDGLR